MNNEYDRGSPLADVVAGAQTGAAIGRRAAGIVGSVVGGLTGAAIGGFCWLVVKPLMHRKPQKE